MTTLALPVTSPATAARSDDRPEGSRVAPAPLPYAVRLVRALADRPYPVVVHGAQTLTAAALSASVVSLAHDLAAVGVGTGSRRVVAVLTGSGDPAALVARYAVHLLGGAVVHLRSRNPVVAGEVLSNADRAEVMHRAGAEVVVADAAHHELAVALAALLTPPTPPTPATPPVVVVDLAAGRPALEPDPPVAGRARAEDDAVLDFTSGTTRSPRLVRHSHASREHLVRRLESDVAGVERPCFLAVTPLESTCSTTVDAVLLAGGRVVIHDGFDAGAVLEAITAEGITHVYLATTHLVQLLEDPRLGQTDLSSLRQVVYSGTPAAVRHVALAAAVFGDRIVQLYGSTELGGICALTALDHREPLLHRAAGRPFPWVELAIRDEETGGPCDDGHPGRVWARSPTAMTGYGPEASEVPDAQHAPRATDAADGGRPPGPGWVDTGDVGHLDRYGYLHLGGRTHGVVKRNGIKVRPGAVEAVLLEHPAVAQAVVEGFHNGQRVEFLRATVALRPGRTLSEPEIAEHVAGLLDEHHVPTEIRYWSGIPLTPSGKPDHALMRRNRR